MSDPVPDAPGAGTLPAATRLALDRTRLAYDRTLLAWIRTATSLISFGFTVYKFFQYLRDDKHIGPQGLIGPRGFGIIMIALGVVALFFATFDHRRHMVELRGEYGRDNVPYALSTALAVLVAAMGVLFLFVVIFRQ